MPEDQATQRNGALAARQAGELAGAYSHTVERLAPDLDLVPVMIQGLDGVIHHWSAGCERLYGFSVTEAVGRVARELLQTESPVPAADIDAALHCDGHWTGELGQRRRDGTR